MKKQFTKYYTFQGAPGLSVEGQKGDPGEPGYSSASLQSKTIVVILFSENIVNFFSSCGTFR